MEERQKLEEFQEAARPELVQCLAQLMSDISEFSYSAGWLMGLEYLLWPIVIGEEPHTSLLLGKDEVARLQTLSALIGGWLYWPDGAGREAFIPLAEWQALYADYKEKYGG